jgi:hypothetical protein
MKQLTKVLGFVAAVVSGGVGFANAGALRDACDDIKAKSPDAVGRANALLVCIEKLAIELEARPIISRGAVLAFEQPCQEPDWKLFDRAGGRFVVGAGHHANSDTRGNQLTIYEKQYLNGGEETHVLTVAELPSHNHKSKFALNGQPLPWGPGSHPIPTSARNRGSDADWNSGGGEPHNNMPPYIALYYCIKK